ncbi:Putative pentatricopeptide repeat-containing protein At3g13770, mitochondrial [Linum perenne]
MAGASIGGAHFNRFISHQFVRQLTIPTSTPISPHTLQSLCAQGNLRAALLEMATQGLLMKFEGYNLLLNECIKRREFREGQRVHSHMIKTCYLPPLYLRTRLIVLYTKCDRLRDARQVFDEMPERNVVPWTAVISAYSQKGMGFEALNLFCRMLRSGTEPNEFTFASVLTSCTGTSGFELGRQIHSLIIKSNYEAHIFVGSSLLDMYAKAGRLHEARKVFEYLPERDVVTCTAMISGYAQMGLDEDALELFRRLQKEGMNSNYVTYASLLTALSGLAALDLGKQVHSHVLRRELPFYVVLLNSMIDMYSKCGSLVYSRRIFDTMAERTVVTWNAMLGGYSKHGMGKETVELFESMTMESKVKPDSVTLLAVLSGCSHGGLEDKGLKIFNEMSNGKYGIRPESEHYGCVVDLLGRKGRVDDAFQFIKNIPSGSGSSPTPAIWGSLLGACRVHSNVDVGHFVGRKLLEIEPENAGNYVILSNLYASAGRWEEMREVRSLMMDKAVTKEPGKSSIEVQQTLHTFYASDRCHPRKEEVTEKVKELSIRFKEAGYVPDLSCVLYDVDDEQKEKILLGHSEKLAMAFGLIAGNEKAPIRVIKNLRVCVDCHNFAKFVSSFVGRKTSASGGTKLRHHFFFLNKTRKSKSEFSISTNTVISIPRSNPPEKKRYKMPPMQHLATASSTIRRRLSGSLRKRGGGSGPNPFTVAGHEERPKGYLFSRTPPPPGQSRKWEDWELPCYITSFLTIVILGVGLNSKPDLTIETWAHQKALERLEMEKLAVSSSSADSD